MGDNIVYETTNITNVLVSPSPHPSPTPPLSLSRSSFVFASCIFSEWRFIFLLVQWSNFRAPLKTFPQQKRSLRRQSNTPSTHFSPRLPFQLAEFQWNRILYRVLKALRKHVDKNFANVFFFLTCFI